MRAQELQSPFEPGSYRKLRSWWMLTFMIVLGGAFIPTHALPDALVIIDALLHVLFYIVLSFIPMIFFRCRKTTFLLAISMAPLGYLIENLHAAVTGGHFDAVSALANNAGVLIGIAAGFIVRLKEHYQREGNP